MKPVILAILLVFGLASTALADAFQFRTARGALAVGAAVYSDGNLVGYTDAQGIIIMSSHQGTRTFSVKYMRDTTTVTLNFTGNPQLQVVPIK